MWAFIAKKWQGLLKKRLLNTPTKRLAWPGAISASRDPRDPRTDKSAIPTTPAAHPALEPPFETFGSEIRPLKKSDSGIRYPTDFVE